MADKRQSEIIGRTARPVSHPRIVRDLRELGVRLADKLRVHTSLSKLGYVPGKLPPLISTGAPMIVGNMRRWIAFTTPNFQGDDFEELGSDFEPAPHTVSVGKVGDATCGLFHMRAAVDFAMNWLRTHRD